MQCEVLQGQLLGGLSQDKDAAPRPNDFPPGGPFDLFGFGQNGPGPADLQNQQGGPNLFPGGLGGAFVGANREQIDQPADAVWEGWPDNVQEIPNMDLNVDPENPPEINLNVVLDMQEMIIDPVVPGPHH